MQNLNVQDPNSVGLVVWPIRDVRRFIAYVAVAIPLVLCFGYLILQGPPVPDSISAYYYSQSMHYVFMVSVIGLGVSLIYYQYRDPSRNNAISWWDTVISSLAGLAAIGVAVFPPSPPDKKATSLQASVNHAHLASTVLFFLSIAVLVLVFFTKSEGVRTRKKRVRNWLYRISGAFMLLFGAVMGGWLLLQALVHGIPDPPHTLVFWCETLSVWFFAFAWLVKGELIMTDKGTDLVQRLIARLLDRFHRRPEWLGSDERAQRPLRPQVPGPAAAAGVPNALDNGRAQPRVGGHQAFQHGDVYVLEPIAQHPLLQGQLLTLRSHWRTPEERVKWLAAWAANVDLLVTEEQVATHPDIAMVGKPDDTPQSPHD